MLTMIPLKRRITGIYKNIGTVQILAMTPYKPGQDTLVRVKALRDIREEGVALAFEDDIFICPWTEVNEVA